MRIIEFRGKAKYVYCGDWVFGSLYLQEGNYYIHNGIKWIAVEDGTICQFTGLYDGTTPLYEGDVILTQEGKRKVIVFDDCAFRLATQKEYQFVMKGEHPFINDYTTLPALAEISMQPFSLIGNVYDNPELMQDE